MNQALKSNNSVESNVYGYDPKSKPSFKYIVIDPDNTWDGIEYVKWNDVLTELMNSSISEVLRSMYDEFREEKFDEDEYFQFCSENLKEAADKCGVRIMTVIR